MNPDPSHMTAQELWDFTRKLIDEGFKEAEGYLVVIDQDLQTIGVQGFIAKLAQARGWANRVLQMITDARRLKGVVTDTTRGKRQLQKEVFFQWIQTHRHTDLKGFDASERGMAAALANKAVTADADAWESILHEMSTLIDILSMRQDDLLKARQDMRATLWAVKLQGVLGELAKDGGSEDQAGRSVYTVPIPEISTSKVEFGNVRGSQYEDDRDLQGPTQSQELDTLLGI